MITNYDFLNSLVSWGNLYEMNNKAAADFLTLTINQSNNISIALSSGDISFKLLVNNIFLMIYICKWILL